MCFRKDDIDELFARWDHRNLLKIVVDHRERDGKLSERQQWPNARVLLNSC